VHVAHTSQELAAGEDGEGGALLAAGGVEVADLGLTGGGLCGGHGGG
jgi:hypothetical protein